MDERTANLVSIVTAVAAIIISTLSYDAAQRANSLASDANGLAAAANRQSAVQHEQALETARRLFDLEREYERPTLSLVRVRRVGMSTFVATIQNRGQRHCAIMSIEYQPQALYKSTVAREPQTHAPVENIAKTFKINLSAVSADGSPWELSRPLTIEPGGLITVELAKPTRLSYGEFHLMSSEGVATGLGYFDDRHTPFFDAEN